MKVYTVRTTTRIVRTYKVRAQSAEDAIEWVLEDLVECNDVDETEQEIETIEGDTIA